MNIFLPFLDPLVMTKLESNVPFCAAFVENPSFATDKDEMHFPDKKQLESENYKQLFRLL